MDEHAPPAPSPRTAHPVSPTTKARSANETSSAGANLKQQRIEAKMSPREISGTSSTGVGEGRAWKSELSGGAL